MLVHDLLDGGQGVLVGHAAGTVLVRQRGKGLVIDGKAALACKVTHPTGDLCAVAACELEELALQVARDQDVHGGAARENELAVFDGVGAFVDEVCENAVLVARAHDGADGHAHLLGIPAGQDVAKVAGGDGDVHGLTGFERALLDELGISAHVVDDLRHQAAPVDGVGA